MPEFGAARGYFSSRLKPRLRWLAVFYLVRDIGGEIARGAAVENDNTVSVIVPMRDGVTFPVLIIPHPGEKCGLAYDCVCWLAWVSAGPDKSRRWFRYDDLNRRRIPGVVWIYIQAMASAL